MIIDTRRVDEFLLRFSAGGEVNFLFCVVALRSLLLGFGLAFYFRFSFFLYHIYESLAAIWAWFG